MELKYLETMRTILNTGSFQKAALRLNYTQSTVTFQVRQLEAEFGVRLFERVGRRMELTEAGKEIMPYIDAVLESTERLRCFGADGIEMTGTLRVAMPETILTYKSQPLLKAFREAAPRVKLLVRTQNCYATRSQLLNGELDVAIHYDVGGARGSVVTCRLAEFRQALVASPSLAVEERDFITPNSNKSLSLISNDKNCISQEIFDRYLRERGIFIENVMELWSVEAIKRSVMSNLGIAFLPYFAVREELENALLIELPTALENNVITALCSYHKNKWRSPAIELFIKLAEEYFSEKRKQV